MREPPSNKNSNWSGIDQSRVRPENLCFGDSRNSNNEVQQEREFDAKSDANALPEYNHIRSAKTQAGCGLFRTTVPKYVVGKAPQVSLFCVRGAVGRYAIAASCIAAAFVIRYSMTPLIGGQSPFMIFAPAALLAARFGGLGPGMAALVAGLVLGDYYFTDPFHSWGPYGAAELTLILTYGVTTAVGVVLFDRLERSRQLVQKSAEDARASAEQARRRGEELEREMIERQRAEIALQKAKEQLTHYATELEERVADRTLKLQESVRSLESVLYHVAHDLRAPLRAMQGFTTILLKEYAPSFDATGVSYARRVSESARRMDELLKDLLEYGQVCHRELLPTRIDLGNLFASITKRFAAEIAAKAAKIEVQRSLPVVWADRQMLETVFTNLLSNALKFVPSGAEPRIQVSAECSDLTVRLWVKDSGIGIEAQYHERIFGIFERIQSDAAGTGIGLAIVQKSIQRMGGRVGVESHLGEGSRFWVELPSSFKSSK